MLVLGPLALVAALVGLAEGSLEHAAGRAPVAGAGGLQALHSVSASMVSDDVGQRAVVETFFASSLMCCSKGRHRLNRSFAWAGHLLTCVIRWCVFFVGGEVLAQSGEWQDERVSTRVQ